MTRAGPLPQVRDAAGLGARDFAAIAVVVTVWGVNFVVMKIGLGHFTPLQLGAGRFVFAFLPMALLLRAPGAPLRWIVGFGLAQGLGQFGLLFFALQSGMSAALASVLLQTHVFFSALLGLLLVGEPVGRPLKFGMPIAAAGLALLGWGVWRSGSLAGISASGIALTLAAAAFWALSNIIVRLARQDADHFNANAFVAWSSAVSILPFLLLTWWLDPPDARANWVNAPWQAWLAIAFLGWVATNLGYGLWTGLLGRFPASVVAPFSLGVPTIGLLAGIVVLDESVSAVQWAGVLCLLCSLAGVVLGPRLVARRFSPAATARGKA